MRRDDAHGARSRRAGARARARAPSGPSELAIDIGTAGSTTLVVQTMLVPALVARTRPLRAVITGGTHNPLAPPFEFLDRVFLPHLRAMGADVTLDARQARRAAGGRRPDRRSRSRRASCARSSSSRRARSSRGARPRSSRGCRATSPSARSRSRRSGCDEPACEIVELPRASARTTSFMVEVELASGARELVDRARPQGLPGRGRRRRRARRARGLPRGRRAGRRAPRGSAAAAARGRRRRPVSHDRRCRCTRRPTSTTIGAFLDMPIATTGRGVVEVVVG